MRTRLLVSLALATYCFLNTWVELAEGGNSYYARHDPRTAVVLPVVGCELLVAALILVVWRALRAYKDRPLPHLCSLALCLAPAGITSVALLRASPVDLRPLVRNPLFWPAALIVAVVPMAFALWRPRRASSMVRTLVLYSWPVLIVILVQAGRLGLQHPGRAFDDGPSASTLATTPQVRVIWIVFDELSRKIAFDERPAGLRLPEFDRLRSESFDASAAAPPGAATRICMPSLILGQTVAEANPVGPTELRMRLRNQTAYFTWRDRPNVFDSARALGYNTAVAGWFHPYGRVLNHSLTRCYWVAEWINSGAEEPMRQATLIENMWLRMRLQFATLPLVGHLPGVFPGIYARRAKIERMQYLMTHAMELATDPSMGLVLVHLSVPHPPPIYSRSLDAMAPNRRNSYLDSIALCDKIVGQLRRNMEERGLWEKSAVLVSADHGWRNTWRGNSEWAPEDEALPRKGTMGVPFILKMPGQSAPMSFATPFNTVVTRAVITGILERKLTRADQLPAMLEKENETISQ